MLKVGVDVGGTFTDVVIADETSGILSQAKVPTTSPNQADGMVDGIRQALAHATGSAVAISNVVQATTLVSNAIVERTGAKTGLVTTRGFRDVLETRREKRSDLYDFNARLPTPLVPRALRLGVSERMNSSGAAVIDIDIDDAERAVRDLLDQGVESLAVCFLHAYMNGAHEQAVRDVILRLAPDIDISLSHEVAPRIREYPRVSTTVANAYIKPLMRRHLAATDVALKEVGFDKTSHFSVSGAVVTSAQAAETPIRLIDSGASAGVMAAGYHATQTERPRVISFEMGGTTAKFCVIDDGQPGFATDFEIDRTDPSRPESGLAIALPAIDLVEIGAGGGSIAWVDELGLLKVGPRSAGSFPGPACYGRGGTEPTATDANVILGYINPRHLLGGQMPLFPEPAKRAIEPLAAKLGMTITDTAWGIYRILTENMLNAAREYLAEKGCDARPYTLLSFGGAGPAYAVRFAGGLGCGEILIPPAAGVASAFGTLRAPLGFETVQTLIMRLSAFDLEQVNGLLREMEGFATGLLGDAAVQPGDVVVRRSADIRYVGQTHEIRVPIPLEELDAASLDAIARDFAVEYERLFHHPNLPYELEFVNWRLFASGPEPQILSTPSARTDTRELTPLRPREHRDALFDREAGFMPCPIFDRAQLLHGSTIRGPAIIEERESTLVIPPGAEAECDIFSNLIVRTSATPGELKR